ncbi:tRNA-nucleotidyltransferase [Babesia gibsoni]|uniref:tRNA-nucleotidyltransferase n=1 Tax=Babesia gibsoni TaxID=33632 RepID=A0AAD8LJ91_BABGI|nr:tRNA-nucleotidyltransferase [Babesia gibsoni]
MSISSLMLHRGILGVQKVTSLRLPYDTGKIQSSLKSTLSFIPCVPFNHFKKNSIHSSMARNRDMESKDSDDNTRIVLQEHDDVSQDGLGKENVVIESSLHINGSPHGLQQSVSIEITHSEKKLFDILKGCVAFHALDIDLRVAGGWVRDKLLKCSSKDIDIAVEKMTGVEFCTYLNAFTKDHLGFQKTVGVVKRRPEQSKHLETATVNILGYAVDFVNLRSEDYAQDSRIPIMKIGTPTEDAVRRDFTINSLFYNISTNTIEDFTGYGIQDLRDGLIRTCSSAFSTFIDDPLRVIRAARFSARLDYKLHEDINKASASPKVLEQLRNKVARARIAQELDDMLSKGNVPKAFELMRSWGVLEILTRDTECDAPNDDQMMRGCNTMKMMRECLNEVHWGNIDTKIAYIAAFCYPIRDTPTSERCGYVEHVIKSRLKLPNKVASGAHTVVEGSKSFETLLLHIPSDTSSLRGALGCVIRDIGVLWREALLLTMANEASNSSECKFTYLKNRYSDILKKINDLKLQEAYLIKAPVSGKQLTELLPGLTPGPMFKQVLDFQVDHLLKNPGLSKDELIQYIIGTFGNKYN